METVVVSEQFVARAFRAGGARQAVRNRTDPGEGCQPVARSSVSSGVRQANPQNADPDPVAPQPFRRRSPGARPSSCGRPERRRRSSTVRQAIRSRSDQPVFDRRRSTKSLRCNGGHAVFGRCSRSRADGAGAVFRWHLRSASRRDAAHVGDWRPHGAGAQPSRCRGYPGALLAARDQATLGLLGGWAYVRDAVLVVGISPTDR